MIYFGQICNLLQCVYGCGIIDGALGTILAVVTAAVGQCPYFQLPGQCVDGTSVDVDIVGIKIGIQSILAVDINGKLLCGLYESIPIPGICCTCGRSHFLDIQILLFTYFV